MRKFLTLLILLVTLSGTAAYAQQMSDKEVIEYLKQAQAAGKTQRQMTTELMRRGVTRQQVERIRDQYLKEQADKQNQTISAPNDTIRRTRTDVQETGEVINERTTPMPVATPTIPIFGHNLFTNANLSFEPNANLATPTNYVLGPGDEVIIDVWGASENTIRQTISPDGNIQISGLGPISLSGMTIQAADRFLRNELSKIYSGPDTQVKLTLGNIRSIQINIMGEVTVPGTYTLSAFSSVFHALYRAGGVNDIGSLRSIKVVRNGRTIADLDVYSFIMKGKMNDDVRLLEGDVIIVEPYKSLVSIEGKVKRPMYYELKSDETFKTLLDYAGGFTGDAYKQSVRLIRKTGREHQIFNIDEVDYSVFRMEDGDEISVDSVLNRYENRIEIRGAVFREGIYQLDGQTNTVKALIKKADGLRENAFLNRAILTREKDNLDHEIISIDLNALLNGSVPDIPLKKNDVLYIPSIQGLKEMETVTIHGEVNIPGTYAYAENMTVEDLIIVSGGLLEDASTVKVDITRRIKDPSSTLYSKEVGKTYTIDITDNFKVGDETFHLEPYDEVYIRKSPAYRAQQNVTIGGEVLFGGNYALQSKNERISSLIQRSGGLTPEAYIKGARLIRTRTEEEKMREMDMLKMARRATGNDSIDVSILNVSNTYPVGIDLEQALRNPNSDYDLVLRDGDVVYIPEYINTIKISGAVMYPNTVLYQKDENLKYYINQAGGFGSNARKHKVYVVNLNGKASKLRLHSRKQIEPGSEIIVPEKDKSNRASLPEMISIGTMTASMAAVIASIIRLFK
ncbi:MAG: SLBB domain-containing protein [Phocaeicola sp.]|uniref:SLBB domain-containing protein n=1 Tax=Phocaeicola TaxID=909656 RepID=UPI00234F6C57|nr:SLBB domain-containing protein [Phocaeicola oris]MCE2615855.1 SLBB domain-containing protein [Phocaeicola oris]